MRFARTNSSGAIRRENTAVAGIEICFGYLSAAFGYRPFLAAAPKPFLTPTKLWRRPQRVLMPELALREWSGAIFTAIMRPRKSRHDLSCRALQTLHLSGQVG